MLHRKFSLLHLAKNLFFSRVAARWGPHPPPAMKLLIPSPSTPLSTAVGCYPSGLRLHALTPPRRHPHHLPPSPYHSPPPPWPPLPSLSSTVLLALYHPRNRYILHLDVEAPDSDRRNLIAKQSSHTRHHVGLAVAAG